jgi:hypothetical protein
MGTEPRPFTGAEFNITEMQRASGSAIIDVPSLDISHYTGFRFRDEGRNQPYASSIQLTTTLAPQKT